MTYFRQLNLIHVFDFYLMAMFLLGTARRLGQYWSLAAIVFSAPGRWPRLLKLMREHRAMFLTWSTFRPAFLALALAVIHSIATRVIWPQSRLTVENLLDTWWVLPLFIITLTPMLAVDGYFLFRIGQVDRAETEKYLDQAEYWLTGHKATVVRIFTLGYVDPRRMVSEEVQKTIVYINELMSRNFHWISLQAGLRILFGLTLWLTWAFLVSSHPA
ncbi:MAG TPA: hypothetical protein VGZ47_06620 [Gemmataceae bacterium]|jgi:hypothetical protein|nr:hypothetical protein [Gemmataceae bacterium]